MGEIEVMQPLPVLRIERLVPHLLQQRIELCRGADRRRLRVASRRVQVSHDNGSHARVARVVRPVLRQANHTRADIARLFEVVGHEDDGHPVVLPLLENKHLHPRVLWSRAPKGSSMRRTLGRIMSAWAIATRCCIPPDSS